MRLPTTEQLAMMAATIYAGPGEWTVGDAVEAAMEIWESSWDYRVGYLEAQKKKDDQ